MTNLIFKPTRREGEAKRQESLARRRLSPSRYRGVASSVEEAHEVQRSLEREGESFDKVWEVSGESKEAKQAHEDVMLRTKINPETNEPL